MTDNRFLHSNDIYSWCLGATAISCSFGRVTTPSPVGNSPLLMHVLGNDPYITTYNDPMWNITPAQINEKWKVKAWVKSNLSVSSCQLIIFGVDDTGHYVEVTQPTFTIYDYWTQITASYVFTNSSTNHIQIRLDGSGTYDDYIWFDGLEVGRDIKSKYVQGKDAGPGTLPKNNDDSLYKNFNTWKKFKGLLDKSVRGGTIFSNGLVSTYSLRENGDSGTYNGGVLSPNGDIHFVPWNCNADRPTGEKIDIFGVADSYDLVYNPRNYEVRCYFGGVLSPNGNIHFVPYEAEVGQKVNINGIVETYSLSYTTGRGYAGGVLDPLGMIHFVPFYADKGTIIDYQIDVGTKVESKTYPLIYTAPGAYCGGVLAPNGEIHFIPYSAEVGQKVDSNLIVTTYTLAYITSEAYKGGVLAPNGDIHFIPYSASVGQKVDINGVVSTYSLVSISLYSGGVLAPNGDIHFIPYVGGIGQKISSSGVVSTYSIFVQNQLYYSGGVLTSNGDIHFVPIEWDQIGQKISTLPSIPFSLTVCQSPFFNKF